ncbi:hypothetical protein [Chlamydiifrater volucris]|uniref:hypothetical protein n=1 Tax=Chlamydiifrater volucris TaxID=2681470 RepID=UPI001BCAC5AD|nr:hypothetical protein [Chlamydiifrater volucris]
MTVSKCLTDLAGLFRTGANIQEVLDEKIEIATRMKELFSGVIVCLGASLLLTAFCLGLLSVVSSSSILILPLLAVSSVLLIGCLLSGVGLALINRKGRALLEESRARLQIKVEMEQARRVSVSSEVISESEEESEAGKDLETRGQEEVDGPFGPKRPVSEEGVAEVDKLKGESATFESGIVKESPIEEPFEEDKVKKELAFEANSPGGSVEEGASGSKVFTFRLSERGSEDEDDLEDSLVGRLEEGISSMKRLFSDTIKLLKGDFIGFYSGSSIPHLGSKNARWDRDYEGEVSSAGGTVSVEEREEEAAGSSSKVGDELKYEDFDF